MGTIQPSEHDSAGRGDILRAFLGLGLTSFGGPVAHLGYFRAAFVARRRWVSEARYADLVAMAQFLPGPASSQVGMGLGLLRGGVGGSLLAWLGFTLPSAVLMIGAGMLLRAGMALPAGAVAGLEAATAAVVAQAVVVMGRTLARGWGRAGLATATCAAVLAVPTPWMPPLALLAAGGVGVRLFRLDRSRPVEAAAPGTAASRRWLPAAALVGYLVILLALPLLARAASQPWLVLLAGCARAGALVFGGGHVVLPLLEGVAVDSGAVTPAQLLAGYGLANALPGPLFSFAGYLGAAAGGVLLGIACTVAIFLPGYLLVLAVLGQWHAVAGRPRLRAGLVGVNAAVVGLLAAALWDPALRSLGSPGQVALAVLAAGVLLLARAPAHLVVLACVLAGLLVL